MQRIVENINFRSFVVTTVVSALMIFGKPINLHAENVLNADAILRSLAPIEYLPEHGGKVRTTVDLEIHFIVNSAILTKSAKRQLDYLAQAMKRPKLKSSTFKIVGHTDASGKASHNLVLSEQRADTVVTYLVKELSIESARLVSSGKGESQLKDLINVNSISNRRVEIINLTPIRVPPRKITEESINDLLRSR